jgi:hypothetical protein
MVTSLVSDAGGIGSSAFFSNNMVPVVASINMAERERTSRSSASVNSERPRKRVIKRKETRLCKKDL